MATGTQIEVVMPQMGVSVSEGTITKWLKQPGEAIARDEALLEISTDKVDTEIPSPGDGIVAEILVAEGETVEVGTRAGRDRARRRRCRRACRRRPSRSAAPEPRRRSRSPPRSPLAASARARLAPGPSPPATRRRGTAARSSRRSSPASPPSTASTRTRSPGTGTGGRVTKKDILAYIESGAAGAGRARAGRTRARRAGRSGGSRSRGRRSRQPRSPRRSAAPPQPAAPAPAAARSRSGEVEEPMTAMRRGVMEHMRRSLDTSAHVSSAIEVDMSRIVAAREQLKKEYQASYGVNPTYLAFIAQATVETLKDYKWVNAEIRGEKIVTRPWVNLGIAVALEDGKGLIVPVIRNAQDLNLLGMARAIADLAARARTKKLLPDDVQGGTFTITNPGGFGTFHGTPIISQPQVGILGTYALVKRPWVVQDELGQDVIAIRPLMNITLTYDHRLVDGAYSGGFLRDLRERLEGWDESAVRASRAARRGPSASERLMARSMSGAYLLDAGSSRTGRRSSCSGRSRPPSRSGRSRRRWCCSSTRPSSRPAAAPSEATSCTSRRASRSRWSRRTAAASRPTTARASSSATRSST